MNTLVDLEGYIVSSNLISPHSDFFNQPKYKLSIQPSYGELMELEQRVEDMKHMNEKPYETEQVYNHTDTCLKDCCVCFENINKPRLVGSIKTARNDSELYGKYVRATGNIQVMPAGNVYIGVFQVQELEPVIDEDVNEAFSYDNENDF